MIEPAHQDDAVTLYHGDCLDVLRELPDASIDAVVTDPPYGLEFMGREWDSFGRGDASSKAVAGMSGTGYTDGANRLERPSFMGGTNPRCRSCGLWQRGGNPCACETPDFPNERRARSAAFGEWCEAWTVECLRVLKPGGHLLAFGGTRTWHRLACAVEDAGFEIRDSIAWLYGSGFPKSLDVSKAIDQSVGVNRDRQLAFTAWMRSTGITADQIATATGTNMASHYLTDKQQPAIATADLFDRLRPYLPDVPEWVERLVAERTGIAWTDYAKRAVLGVQQGAMSGWSMDGTTRFVDRDITSPHNPEAVRWQGWGTALKPAFEPIVVGRKPLAGTVAANVLAHGTGALNIDASRVGDDGGARRGPGDLDAHGAPNAILGAGLDLANAAPRVTGLGRWPTNVVLDESQAAELDRQSGTSASRIGKPRGAANGDGWGMTATGAEYDDQGGASRFFPTFRYEAKAPTAERPRAGEVAHPTVKPLDLMRWLVRLVTPPGGVVLEPFAGSGTTAEACVVEGFRCIAIEREADYLPLIVQRLTKPIEMVLDFGGAA